MDEKKTTPQADPRASMRNAMKSVKKQRAEARDKALESMDKLLSGDLSRHSVKMSIWDMESVLRNESAVKKLGGELTHGLTGAKDLLATLHDEGDGKSAADTLDERAKTLIQEMRDKLAATSSELPDFDSVYERLQNARRVPKLSREEWQEIFESVGQAPPARRGRPPAEDEARNKPTEEELIKAINLLEKLDGEFVRYAKDRLNTLLDKAATWEEAREAAEALGRLRPKGGAPELPKYGKHKRGADEKEGRLYAGVLRDLQKWSNGEQSLEDFFAKNETPEDGARKWKLVDEEARKAVGRAETALEGLVDGAGEKEREKLDETAKNGVREALKELGKYQTTFPSANRVLPLAGGNPKIGYERYKKIKQRHDEAVGDPLKVADNALAVLRIIRVVIDMAIQVEETRRRKLRSTTQTPLTTSWMRPDQIGLVIAGGDDRELRALDASIAELRALRDETRRVADKLAACLRAYRADHDA